MKRILSLILCGVLCLGLCACGASGGSKHEQLLAMLDEHDYTGAVQYINDLAYEYAQDNKDPAADEYVYTPALYGEWVAYNAKDGVTVPKVEFKEDGTCLIGDNEYLWQAGHESDTNLDITILDGAEQVYSFSISKDKTKGHFTGQSGNIVKDAWLNFYNPAHYEVVEITVDNFADYFDTKSYFTYSYNDFSEVTGVSACKQWSLKETYYSRLWTTLSEVAVEYTSYHGKQYARWDLAAKTCAFTDKYEPQLQDGAPRLYTATQKMGSYSDSSTETEDDYDYGYRYESTYGTVNSKGEQYFSNYITEEKLTRVEGKLYLVKEDIKNLIKTEE